MNKSLFYKDNLRYNVKRCIIFLWRRKFWALLPHCLGKSNMFVHFVMSTILFLQCMHGSQLTKMGKSTVITVARFYNNCIKGLTRICFFDNKNFQNKKTVKLNLRLSGFILKYLVKSTFVNSCKAKHTKQCSHTQANHGFIGVISSLW